MINSAVCDKFEKKEHGIIFNDDAKIFTVTEFSFLLLLLFLYFSIYFNHDRFSHILPVEKIFRQNSWSDEYVHW